MPRIRTIKPDFFTDGKVVSVSPAGRLLFVGMWVFANCDNGHVDDDPISLKLRILPVDNVDVHVLIDELLDVGLIKKIDIAGKGFYLIPGLRNHQKTDTRWSPRCDACKHEKESSEELTETHASLGETPRDSPELTETQLFSAQEGKGKERNKTCSSSTSVRITRFDEFWSAYPRKVGKEAAKTKYSSAAKKVGEQNIIDGAHRLADDPNLPEKRFIPYPATWLGRGGWEDEPLPPRITPAETHDPNASQWARKEAL